MVFILDLLGLVLAWDNIRKLIREVGRLLIIQRTVLMRKIWFLLAMILVETHTSRALPKLAKMASDIHGLRGYHACIMVRKPIKCITSKGRSQP